MDPIPAILSLRRTDEHLFGYTFDRVILELGRGRLLVDGKETASLSLPTKLLQALCEQPGMLISRPELFEFIWPRQVVSDEALTKVIGRLRELLGPYSARLVTVRSKGLRLDATVRKIESDPSQIKGASRSASGSAFATDEHGDGVRSRPVILIVDDDPDSIVVLSTILTEKYQTKVTTNHESALRAAKRDPKPDLILLDVAMPIVDGYAICKQLKASAETTDIPVIFLTAKTSIENEVQGFSCGAIDYVTKPFSPPLVLTRIATHLSLKQAREELRDHNKRLEQLVEQRTHELVRAQDATIMAMAVTSEAKNSETINHIRRIQHYVELLARELKNHPRFVHEINDDNISLLFKSASLHDIGNVGVPDHVLQKPTLLTPEEMEAIRIHTLLGNDIVRNVERCLGESSDFLRFAREIAYSHHERWDGSGYPDGLTGDEIPVSARLVAVADVYDALMTQRSYRPRHTHEESIAIMRDMHASQFDPDILSAFLKLESEFYEIFELFSESATEFDEENDEP